MLRALKLLRFSFLLALATSACSATSPTSNIPVVAVSGSETPPILVAGTSTAEPRPPARTQLTAIAWETSEEMARSRAKARHWPLVVYLCAEWSAAAIHMDRSTWTEPRLLERSRTFVALRIDTTTTDANAQAVADRFDLKTMPSTVILDFGGHEIARLEGDATAEQILAALARVATDDN